jgi:hypothetical protein
MEWQYIKHLVALKSEPLINIKRFEYFSNCAVVVDLNVLHQWQTPNET